MASANRFNKWSWRVYPLWLLLVVALVAIVIRLGQLQIVDSERGRLFLQQQGDARVLRTEKIKNNNENLFSLFITFVNKN